MAEHVLTLRMAFCTSCDQVGKEELQGCMCVTSRLHLSNIPICTVVICRSRCQARISMKGSTVVSVKGGHDHEDARALIQTLLVEENNVQRAAATPKV